MNAPPNLSSLLAVPLAGGVALAALADLARTLPIQNILMIAVSLPVGEGLVAWLEPRTSGRWGIAAAALMWSGVILVVRRAGQYFLRSHRRSANYGLCLLAWCGAGTALLQGIWNWNAPALVIRFLTTVALLVALTPWLIDKRAASQLSQ